MVWVSVILALLLIGTIVIERVIHDANRNKILESQASLIARYKTAPARIDTVHDTIHLPGHVFIKPVPFKVVIHDSILVPYRESWYDSVFNQRGIRFRWTAKGQLNYITFSDFVWPKEIITITRQVDTCFAKPFPKQPFFRIGPYVGLSLNSFTKFPGIEAGAKLVIKDQITVSAGVLYLDEIYANVRLGWLVK